MFFKPIYSSIALSVILPPTTLLFTESKLLSLFINKDISIIFLYLSFILEYSIPFPIPSNNPTTDNLPSVSVPVLSVNKTFIFPAVSIPTNFLTKTLFFNILCIFELSTKVIIIGNPSGTDTTIIVTHKVKASSIYPNNKRPLEIVEDIKLISKLFLITII